MQRIASWAGQFDDAGIGEDIYALAAKIFPICRSITGDGVRKTLACLARYIDLKIHEVPTGTQVFDWVIPREWNIRDAYIMTTAGEKIVDFQTSNLHVLNYSAPIRQRVPLSELKKHLHTLPDQPDLIPYRTSYYARNWGFCMTHNQFMQLKDDHYDVVIDSSLEDGHLTYGEYLHRGSSDEEVLLSAHICHPSLANDNCSGVALLTHFAERLAPLKTRYSYRFLFAPGTIGAITWLARNRPIAQRIKHGLVVSCVGDAGGPTYKKSRRGNAVIDRAMAHVIRQRNIPTSHIIDFFPYGYDERQYCSPGFNLPVGLFQRSQFGTFPEYHTSADNLDFISAEHLELSYQLIKSTLDIVEHDGRPRSTMPYCEPQLGRRGLYGPLGGNKTSPQDSIALLWVLNLADDMHTLLDIAERANLPFGVIADAARRLQRSGLLVF